MLPINVMLVFSRDAALIFFFAAFYRCVKQQADVAFTQVIVLVDDAKNRGLDDANELDSKFSLANEVGRNLVHLWVIFVYKFIISSYCI